MLLKPLENSGLKITSTNEYTVAVFSFIFQTYKDHLKAQALPVDVIIIPHDILNYL
jgi:hypothetical protein